MRCDYYFVCKNSYKVLWWVCLSVCVSFCLTGYLWNPLCDLYQFFVHVAYGCGSVLLRQIDNRPHSLSPGTGWRAHWQCIVMWSQQITSCRCRTDHSLPLGGDGSAQRRRSVIYDCLVGVLRHIIWRRLRTWFFQVLSWLRLELSCLISNYSVSSWQLLLVLLLLLTGSRFL